ncbi:MAG: hypothetical protein A2374_05375 [Candidatus Moranbacteria bacterium RIFOXYB1_FULL_44_23]|nr:MAG: hypothetical protein A2194_03935 [Candidatus Moranbacteria bacterium RIFOXYA1_FULL_44_8]OGI36947.1 MAG: hypothetical protein A2407_04620 [Candidatus Moranbacteria bacterium RIFOXYC1_FULL_44_8]OGI40190.1 MAG: hypothetical protein A2374_05375 [Candidatus Moranbacteria bacterium RIFOXYB1_FULL_44_23]OGI43104.1 MAG: hypothetical protein A2593_00820 [Candidatus Moranbacteria bacterium RIFOXYD1_FULL_44_9]
MEVFIGLCIILKPDVYVVLLFFVFFQLCVIYIPSNTAFDEEIQKSVGILLDLVILCPKLFYG